MGKQFKKGDLLYIRKHTSEEGKGLTYPHMIVLAKEAGNDSGWDVFSVITGGVTRPQVLSIYGFSVTKVVSLT